MTFEVGAVNVTVADLHDDDHEEDDNIMWYGMV